MEFIHVDKWQGRQSACWACYGRDAKVAVAGMPSEVRMPTILDEVMVYYGRHTKVATAGLPSLAGMPSGVRMPTILDEVMLYYGRHTKVTVAGLPGLAGMPSKVRMYKVEVGRSDEVATYGRRAIKKKKKKKKKLGVPAA